MSGKPKQARSVARLAAVQALYQMEVSGVGVEAVIREFTDHRFDRGIEGEESATLASADESFFAELVRGVVGAQREIDAAVVKRLASGWRLERLDATVRAILRAGAFRIVPPDRCAGGGGDRRICRARQVVLRGGPSPASSMAPWMAWRRMSAALNKSTTNISWLSWC